MSSTELTEAFFAKSAGWEAVQSARALLAAGKVISSNWSPPSLKGMVQEDTASYRAGLVIKGPVDIDNFCTCRAAREAGIICARSVAVGLHQLQHGKAPPRGNPTATLLPAHLVGSLRALPFRVGTAPRATAGESFSRREIGSGMFPHFECFRQTFRLNELC
jgi:hypothetical protein